MNFQDLIHNHSVMWFLAGLVLLALEFAVPGVFILFFGLGAWVTSLAVIMFNTGLNDELIIFLVSSILLLVLLRKQIKKRLFKGNSESDNSLEEEFIGKQASCTADIVPPNYGKIEFNGTTWEATAEQEIMKGQAVIIDSKESIKLHVKPKIN